MSSEETTPVVNQPIKLADSPVIHNVLMRVAKKMNVDPEGLSLTLEEFSKELMLTTGNNIDAAFYFVLTGILLQDEQSSELLTGIGLTKMVQLLNQFAISNKTNNPSCTLMAIPIPESLEEALSTSGLISNNLCAPFKEDLLKK